MLYGSVWNKCRKLHFIPNHEFDITFNLVISLLLLVFMFLSFKKLRYNSVIFFEI